MTTRALALSLLLLAAGGSALSAQSLSEPVMTETGAVVGTGDGVRAFKGIPYAKAPVGPLRWQPPQRAESWAGALDGSKFGPDCMQPAEYPELRGAGMSEDCLSINVWTPARRADEALPVMVWVYGGGFTYGSGSHPSYDGAAFARRGVILVSFNYRMGLLGFLAHPELSAASATTSSGNYALMDIEAALRWVQRNIKAFGGDPRNVTVFGQSAGALMTTTLMAAPASKGLFERAIIQSGGVMRPMASLKQAEAYGATIGDLTSLKDMTGDALVKKHKDLTAASDRNLTGARMLGPIVDGALVTEDDRLSIASGRFNLVPMIVSTISNEGGGFARNSPIKSVVALRGYLDSNFQGSGEKAAAIYPAEADAAVTQLVADIFGDTQFNFGSRELMRHAASKQIPIYRALFTRSRNNVATAPIHGDELQFVFDNLNAPHRGRVRPSDAKDAEIATLMANAWVRFAKTGSPNGGNLPQWPTYEARTETYMEFGATTRVATGNRTPQLDFIRDYYAIPTR